MGYDEKFRRRTLDYWHVGHTLETEQTNIVNKVASKMENK